MRCRLVTDVRGVCLSVTRGLSVQPLPNHFGFLFLCTLVVVLSCLGSNLKQSLGLVIQYQTNRPTSYSVSAVLLSLK